MLRDSHIYENEAHMDESHSAAKVHFASKPTEMITKKRADLIFCSVNKNKANMNFENYLQALIKIGQSLYPQYEPSAALQMLVRSRMLPLHDQITN